LKKKNVIKDLSAGTQERLPRVNAKGRRRKKRKEGADAGILSQMKISLSRSLHKPGRITFRRRPGEHYPKRKGRIGVKFNKRV